MEDFAGKLYAFPKWHDKHFVNEQLKKHLMECFTLLDTKNPHAYNELIDLIQIAKVHLKNNLDTQEIDERYQKRFGKFMEKLGLDSKRIPVQYTDILYGDLEITEPVVLEILHSPAMQRLKHIDQNGYYEPYFPNSKHDRLEHSLGVYHLLKRHGAPMDEQLAGLLHDLSHGSFSHCLDYVFEEGSQKEQSHQDNIFEEFVKSTEIPDILKAHGYDVHRIVDDTHFPLKERDLPDLCADRLDYSLRDALYYRVIDMDTAVAIKNDLQIKDGVWCFSDYEMAAKYTQLFYDMNEYIWSGIDSGAMHYSVGECLKHAWKQGYVERDDFYTTDQQVIDKLLPHLDKDPQLQLLWDRMNNQIPFSNNPQDYHGKVFCKTRIVDPFFLEDGKLKRISEVDSVRKEIMMTKNQAKEYFIKYER